MLSDEQKKDIEMIMRQTSVLDVKQIQDVYMKNKQDVLNTICDLLEIKEKTVAKKPFDDQFAEIRKVLEEKDEIFEKVLAIKKK